MRPERPKRPMRLPGRFTLVISDAGDYAKRPIEIRLRATLKYLLRALGIRVESIVPIPEDAAEGGPL